MPEEIDAIAAR
jgi:hypothetical protein